MFVMLAIKPQWLVSQKLMSHLIHLTPILKLEENHL